METLTEAHLERSIEAKGAGRTTDGRLPPLELVDELLRDRQGLLARIAAGRDLTHLARTMIATIALSTASFGAALGTVRGGIQILYGAVKMPLVVLLTAAICAPTLSAFNHALRRRTDLKRDLALVLATLALSSLVMAALGPVLLFAASRQVDYHKIVLLTVVCCAIGGGVGLAFFSSGLRHAEGRGGLLVTAILLAVFALVGAQMAWTLRPYLVRPQSEDVPFVRPLDSDFFSTLAVVFNSARGYYGSDIEVVRVIEEAEWEREVQEASRTLQITEEATALAVETAPEVGSVVPLELRNLAPFLALVREVTYPIGLVSALSLPLAIGPAPLGAALNPLHSSHGSLVLPRDLGTTGPLEGKTDYGPLEDHSLGLHELPREEYDTTLREEDRP